MNEEQEFVPIYPNFYNSELNTNLEFSFGNRLDSNIPENSIKLFGMLPDLVVRKRGKIVGAAVLSTSLVLANGFAALPVYKNDNDDERLYAVNGAKLLKHAPFPNMGITVMDFSSFNTVEIDRNGNQERVYPTVNVVRVGSSVTASTCTATKENGKLVFTFSSALTIDSSKFIITSIFGRLHFSYTRNGNKLIVENLPIGQMAYTKLDLDMAKKDGYDNNVSTRSPNSEAALLKSMEDISSCTFVYIVDAPLPIFVKREQPLTIINDNRLVFPKRTDGILVNKMTGKVCSHNVQHYETVSVVQLNPSDIDIVHSKISHNHMERIGVIASPKWFKQKTSVSSGNYEMIKIYYQSSTSISAGVNP